MFFSKIKDDLIIWGYVWIGLNDLEVEGRWDWIDGTTAKTADIHWGSGQPDGGESWDCGEMDSGNYKTYDYSCLGTVHALCEIKHC